MLGFTKVMTNLGLYLDTAHAGMTTILVVDAPAQSCRPRAFVMPVDNNSCFLTQKDSSH